MELIEAVKQLGIPLGILAVFLAAGWRLAKFFGERILRPLVKSHLDFLDMIADFLHASERVQKSLSQSMEQLSSVQKDVLDLLQQLQDEVRMIRKQYANDPGANDKPPPRP